MKYLAILWKRILFEAIKELANNQQIRPKHGSRLLCLDYYTCIYELSVIFLETPTKKISEH